jgi:hypothetical protein
MKKNIAALILFAAATWAMAFDVPVRWPDGRIREGYPKRIGAVVNPTPETCAANGYPLATKAEVEAQDKADAKADADAQAQAAQYAFPSPEVVVPVLDANGERTGTARLLVDAAGQIVVVTDTASPQRTAAVQIAEFKAKRDAAAAKLATAKAGANGQLQKRIENIEAMLGIREKP